ncbi:ATP-dependent RNA helicase DEAH13 isoform X2 [Physcomitrium patens]|nr:ATP-dependent RNA helicase DEAH13-like isoform X2 [Physcomitrium patens]|eukprot:XP_024370812.1 ATP-dependent RNA helicase DEAH13-like isoform X2 [Physcomitrella patens]
MGVDCSNMEMISGPKKKKEKQLSQLEQDKQVKLSKNMQRKLRRLQEEEEKKKLRVQVMETLQKHKLADDKFGLLHSSGTLGQEETMKEKLQRAMNYKRAGLPVPSGIPLFRERPGDQHIDQVLMEEEKSELLKGVASKISNKTSLANAQANEGVFNLSSTVASKGLKRKKDDSCIGTVMVGDHNQSLDVSIPSRRTETHCGGASNSKCQDDHGEEIHKGNLELTLSEMPGNEMAASFPELESAERGNPGKKCRKNLSSENAAPMLDVSMSTSVEPSISASCVNNSDSYENPKKKKKKKQKKKKEEKLVEASGSVDDVDRMVELEDFDKAAVSGAESEGILPSLRPHDVYLKESLNTQAEKADLKLRKVAVPISRPEDVERGRENLPIVMMEQEIVEAISENDVVIVCGETGCGKTTQVPQFLFEAGFGSSLCPEKSGVIGVTQPRRVAVLATARRVAYEMNVTLGQEVGFQVRHDRKIGINSCIKFMTDGILLREIQADFLLKKYSVVILDEAHERSLNTDILIGMLSRILPLRKKMYEEYCQKMEQLGSIGSITTSEAPVMPLKLVIMSATLRVEDFTSNRRMYPISPPVIQVPARQFPVTVHFSAKTEMIDYVGRAQKKVCAIHRKLPPGGILVFLTGQREVEYLCRKLRRVFKPKSNNGQSKGEPEDSSQRTDVQGLNLESISKAMDGHLDSFEGNDGGGLGGIAEVNEDDEEKGENGNFSESDDKDFSDDHDEDSISDSDEEDVVNLQSSLDAVEDTSKKDADVDQTRINSTEIGNDNILTAKLAQSTDPGPLYVLPLYAMLPAAAQLRVFAQVPEGARLVVVATNVAETSITIPGIRYVVDTGRSKERDFDRANGMSKYEVRWISKASANQRAGRAGRTGPGHCYRLYSSAVFNNIFPKFSPPEISSAPIEGVVLVMKRMGISKVINFPFPTPPDRQALLEADRCLRALSALGPDGNLTPIGKAMAVYPISPRHARMILAALHASQGMDGRGHIVVAFAVAAAAALSLENPFLRESGIEVEDLAIVGAEKNGNNPAATKASEKQIKSQVKDGDSELTEEEKKKRKQRRAEAGRAHGKYRNTNSDALSVVNALWAYEKAENREQFCEINYLHGKTMQEMSKLRQQLSQLVLQYSLDAGAHVKEQHGLKDEPGLTKDYLLECEKAWHLKDQLKLNVNQEMVIQQAICAGWSDRVAHRLSARELALIPEEDGKRKAVRYQACAVEETVFLHPASALAKEAPEFVVYNEIISTGRPYMWGVTAVKANWLVSHATPLCTFSKPVADPPPWYDPSLDTVMCWVLPTFGPHRWELPPHPIPLNNSKARASVFAAALLEGKVIPSFRSLLPHLAADPAIIIKPESHGQVRVGELLHKLGTGLETVDSRKKLAKAWQRDPMYLYSEVLAWVQNKAHAEFKQIWDQCLKDATMDGTTFQSKKSKKRKT